MSIDYRSRSEHVSSPDQQIAARGCWVTRHPGRRGQTTPQRGLTCPSYTHAPPRGQGTDPPSGRAPSSNAALWSPLRFRRARFRIAVLLPPCEARRAGRQVPGAAVRFRERQNTTTTRGAQCYAAGVISQSQLTEPPAERRITFADWISLPEDEPGELVDGRLVEEEVPDAVHEVIVAWVIRVLGGWLVPQGGLVLGSEAKYAVSAVSGRKPDASAYMPGSRKPPRRGPISAPPDLMVEVLSPSPRDARRDRVEKLYEYASFGVRWYWIIDPQGRTLEILELGTDHRYVHTRSAAEGIVDGLPGLDGLTLDLDALWSEVERLGPESGEGALGDPEA